MYNIQKKVQWSVESSIKHFGTIDKTGGGGGGAKGTTYLMCVSWPSILPIDILSTIVSLRISHILQVKPKLVDPLPHQPVNSSTQTFVDPNIC
jgi:hypothetical protein